MQLHLQSMFFETEKEYKVELAAPGMTKRTSMFALMKIFNNLVISMEKKTEKQRRERERRSLSTSRILLF